jgi:Tol biopolymer transport system component
VIGTTLGHYRVVEKRGEVYAAEDTKLGRRVALRVLPPEMVADAARLERFEDEARAVAALNHPNIVNIYSIEEADGVGFLTLELVEGTPLAEVIPKDGLPLEDLLKLAVPLVDAVACAHEHSIVHGELKPANIIVAGDGRPKVLEFGLATLKRANGSAELKFGATTVGGAAETTTTVVGAADTTTAAAVSETVRVVGAADATTNASAATGARTTAVGTDATYRSTQPAEQRAADGEPFAYLSPEQAEGRPVDHRSDIFSLGVVLYEMACGQRPFKGDTAVTVVSSILRDTPAPVSAVNRAVPRALERIITCALAKDPAERYQNARDLCSDLRDVQQQAASGHLLSSLVRVVVRFRWTPRLAVAASLVVLAVAGILVLAPLRAGRQSPPVAAALRFRTEQLTSEPGVEQFPSLTPDGKWVVFTGHESGNPDIYIQSTSGQNPINLTADSPAEDDEPAVSPDGERIAFRSSRDGGGIFVMGRTGEEVSRVTPAGVSAAFNPTWSPDGTEIAYTTEDVQLTPLNGERRSELWIANLRTGARRKLDVIDAVQANWSPHGHRIAYWDRRWQATPGDKTGVGVTDVWTIPARGGEPVAATRDAPADWSPVWSRDGRHLYFVSDRGGSMNLWRVAIDEISGKTLGDPQPITTPAQFVAHPTISADGRLIAYCAMTETANIQTIRLDPVKGTVQGEPTWVTTGSQAWANPDPTWDGEWLVAYTRDQPEGHLYVMRPDGTRQRSLTADEFVDRVPRWSPDKTWVAFMGSRNGPLTVWKIRADGSGLQPVSETGSVPVWSADGARLATSASGSASGATYVVDPNWPWNAQTPETLELPDEALRPFLAQDWSKDGSRLAGQIGWGRRSKGIVVYTFASRVYERLTEFGEWPSWLPDSRRVLFVADGKAFWIADARTKQTRMIFSELRDVLGPPRLTRDGRSVFFPRGVKEGDIYLLRFEDR